MSRTLTGGVVLCGESFGVTVQLPDEYFDHNGCPLWHKINNRFGAQANWYFDKPIGGVPVDKPVTVNPLVEELKRQLALYEQLYKLAGNEMLHLSEFVR